MYATPLPKNPGAVQECPDHPATRAPEVLPVEGHGWDRMNRARSNRLRFVFPWLARCVELECDFEEWTRVVVRCEPFDDRLVAVVRLVVLWCDEWLDELWLDEECDEWEPDDEWEEEWEPEDE